MPQITAILRNYDHLMQVLPFGLEAGHFRDITALVATKSLSRIPLAYTYREGDYATKIDILLLCSQIWEESYFPPPGDDSSPHFSQSPSQNHDGPSNPQPRSPSSSASSGAPSEPTIDLSAWSPRSRKIYSPTSQIWDFQPTQAYHYFLGNKQVAMLINLLKATPFFSSDSRYQIDLHTHERSHTSATKDPNLPKTPTQLSSILYTYLTAVPNPIAINHLISLRTINSTTLSLGEAQKSLKTDSHCTISLTRSRIEASKSTGIILETSHIDLILPSKDEADSKGILNITLTKLDLHTNASPPSLVPICTFLIMFYDI